MNDTILVVGAGPTGLSAAHGIASVGRKVVLVDKAERLGGAPILSGYAKLVPSGEWAKEAIGRMVERVEKNPLVTVHKQTTVTKLDGEHGDFNATLSSGETVKAAAVVLGTASRAPRLTMPSSPDTSMYHCRLSSARVCTLLMRNILPLKRHANRFQKK